VTKVLRVSQASVASQEILEHLGYMENLETKVPPEMMAFLDNLDKLVCLVQRAHEVV
jgi:hypothetical protein